MLQIYASRDQSATNLHAGCFKKTKINSKPRAEDKRRLDYAEAKQDCNEIKINSKPRAEDKRSLYYAEAKQDCNEIKINSKPRAEDKRSLDYAGAKQDCNEVKIKFNYYGYRKNEQDARLPARSSFG